jgi:hypothetical protein
MLAPSVKIVSSPIAVAKVQQVGAASLQRCWHFSRSATDSTTRAARLCLVLIACLAQLWMPAHRPHAPGFPAQAMSYGAAATANGPETVSIGARQSGPCPLHDTHAGSQNNNGPAPCPDCPFCPCPCCAPLHAAMGILPQQISRIGFERPFSEAAPPPAVLGSALRFAVVAGQPRAPPVLI